MANKNLPNFLIVGTAKAGTSSIAKYLDAHPNVFIPELKEPRYFLHDIFKTVSDKDPMFDYLMKSSILDWNDYLNLYTSAPSKATRLGDASIQYLYHFHTAIPQIKEKLGDIPIIIVLRNPIKRAFSNYKYQSNMELLSFQEALCKEEERKKKNYNSFWFYKEMGLYYNQVKAYKDAFSNVHICFHEDLIQDPKTFMDKMYNFLSIPDNIENDYKKRYNETITPKNNLIQYVNFMRNRWGISLGFIPKKYKEALKGFFFQKNTDKISKEDYQFLRSYFIEDIKKLETLIDRDLSHWYKEAV